MKSLHCGAELQGLHLSKFMNFLNLTTLGNPPKIPHKFISKECIIDTSYNSAKIKSLRSNSYEIFK